MAFNLFSKKKKKKEKPTDTTVIDLISPPGISINSNFMQVGKKYARTIFIVTYPRALHTAWFSPVITLDRETNVSMFIHPADSQTVLKNLEKKSARVQSQIALQEEKGKVRDPILETALQDIEELRDSLQQGSERLFKFGLYITFFGDTIEELDNTENEIRSLMEVQMVYAKPAVFQQEQGFISTLPLLEDRLSIHNSFNTSPLSSTFPFVSSDLTDNKGVLYGINRHNNSLILFDRFSLENANMCVFAKAGAGKSIGYHEPVLIKDKKGVKLQTIGPLVERLIKKHKLTKIDNELEGVVNPQISVYSFNKKLEAEWSKVTVAARKKAPKYLYRFTTASGRQITTTADHNMLKLKNGKVFAAKSKDIKAGDYIPLTRTLPEPAAAKKSLNLLSLLKSAKGIYIHGAASLIKQNYQFLKSQAVDPKYDRYLYKYKGDRRMPIKYFLQLLECLKIKNSSSLAKQLQIASCRHKNREDFRLNAYFVLKKSFFRLLGYIVSEGTVQEKVVLISNQDPVIIKDIKNCLKDLGVGYHLWPSAVAIATRPFVELIKTIGASGNSAAKKIPGFIFNQSNSQAAEFIKSYFEGDGGVERSQVVACSKSSRLINELSYLLLRYGIIARIKSRRKRATNSQAEGIYWHLSISGQENLQRFAEKIGFVSNKKQQKLLGLLNKKSNSNVDVIPTVDSLLQDIFRLFEPAHQYFQLAGIPYLSDLRSGKRKPSPASLNKIILEIENRLSSLKRTGLQLASFDPVSLTANLASAKNNIHLAFKDFGLSMKSYHPHLRDYLINPARHSSYIDLSNLYGYMLDQYQGLCFKVKEIEEKLFTLKTLANCDLFWDPVISIKKEANKDKYVYDLTVDNEVFLAGQGGLFVHNSFSIKLEVLRSLMQDTEVIIIDPEKEYKYLAETVDGAFVDISLTSPNHINPFDLPIPGPGDKPANLFKSNILNLVGLLKMMLGGLTPEEDAILDKAVIETYASRDITPDSDFSQITSPLMQDLQTILRGMEGAEGLAVRLEKYVKGSYAGFFNQPTNIRVNKKLVVFSIRDMEDQLRPLAMYMILHYIWNLIRSEMKKRIMVIDEAWWMMQHEDAASFLFGLAKRCRKYYMGLTTITQDVTDFLASKYGKPILTNSSLQLLMKQSPAAIDVIQQTFSLTEQEKYLLLECGVGEGIFFAGAKHAAIKVEASYTEDQIITTDPAQLMELEKAKEELAAEEEQLPQ